MVLAEENALSLSLPWEALKSIVQGTSAIDLTTMPIQDREEAYSLVFHYGYDLNQHEDALEVQAIFTQAVDFIERRLLNADINWEDFNEPPSPRSSIPESLVHRSDVLDLILTASEKDNPHRPWACAILKVMHTVAHIQNGRLYKYYSQASDAILSRFYAILEARPDGTYLLKGNERTLKLAGFETKPLKARESILVKLLCKKENVAEDIWDLIGVRLITYTAADAIIAIDILREQKVFVFPNVIPSRSRNTLVDIDDFQSQYDALMREHQSGQRHFENLAALLSEITVKMPEDNTGFSENIASSVYYRSIHFTCRQLLRLKSPGSLVEDRFVFPYEIQLQDETSYKANKDGLSAHGIYKQRQLFAARRRVLGPLLLSQKVQKQPATLNE